MSAPGEMGFLDFLREAGLGQGRGNDELVRAIVPLMRQTLDHHDEGRVAPLAGVSRLFADGGHLWFHDADAEPPRIDKKALRALEKESAGGVQVVDRTSELLDLTGEAAVRQARSRLVGVLGEPLTWPVYLPAYIAWEQELEHHDALVDIFCLGMLLASLAVGADFTEPDELARFVAHRRSLQSLNPGLHPVIARAITRMTELDRHKRAQDLPGLIARLERYREVDEQADAELDFGRMPGFKQADLSSRRLIIQRHLQSRLFDLTRRNRLIWFRPTLRTLDLTEASVPAQLHVERIKPEELFLWEGPAGKALSRGKPFRLDRFLRFEEAPWLRGVLDQVRSQARRDRAEFGMSQLRLVIGFLNWHDLREDPDRRVRSPLLLLPVKLGKKRGVRDSYVLEPLSEVAEVNPVLRHLLAERFDLELPEEVDLSETDLPTFHRVLAAAIARSEPAVSLHYLTRPQIRLIHKRARRRLEAWRRRSTASGRGVRRHGEVSYSYGKRNFSPLGLQLYLQRIQPERLTLAEHFKSARVVAETTTAPSDPDEQKEEEDVSGARLGTVQESEREVYQITEEATGPYDWAVDLTRLTLGNFNYRKMSLVRDYDRLLSPGSEAAGDAPQVTPLPEEAHAAFDAVFSLDARPVVEEANGSGGAVDPFAPYLVVPADPTQTAAVLKGRTGSSFIIQGPPGTGKSQTITNLIADFAARGKHVLFVCEKRAALDVVYHRLAQHGLDELSVLIHDSQGDKKAFIGDLKETYETWIGGLAGATSEGERRPAEEVEAEREALRQRIAEPLGALRRFSEGMCAPAEGSAVSVAAVLRERLACPALPERLDPGLRLPDHQTWQGSREIVHGLGRALAGVGEPPIVAQLGVRRVAPALLEDARPTIALREAAERLGAHLDAARAARDELGLGETAAELADALALARELADLAAAGHLSLLDPGSAASQALAEHQREQAGAQDALARAEEAAGGWRERLPRADLSAALAIAGQVERWIWLLRWLLPGWWRLRGVLGARYDFERHAVKPTWTSVLGQLTGVYDAEDAAARVSAEGEARFGQDPAALAARVAELREASGGRSPLQRTLLARWRQDAGRGLEGLLQAADAIDALAALAEQVFVGGGALPLDTLAAQLSEAEAAADLLPEVRTPLLALQQGPALVREAVCHAPLTPAQWDAAVCDDTLGRTFRRSRPLSRFDAQALEQARAQVRDGYDAWLAANAAAVRARARRHFQERVRQTSLPAAQLDAPGKALKKAYNAGRRELEREFRKVMRHKSIRSLTDGDSGTVVYDLKPIWLMSPLSISDTLPIDEQRFDVVIFDEASQIPLEEAVPAVVRAPQMIVVGDEMQLPPTSFFSAARGGDDEDAADMAARYDLDSDSFLNHVAQRLPSTLLGWHYRSRFEALIRFSNEAFYAGELLTIPDRRVARALPPIATDDADAAWATGYANAASVLDRPVSFHLLEGSAYVQRRNPGEAAYIAQLVRGLLEAPGRPTIGVVAFSEAQQGAIEQALRALAETDPEFGRRLEAEFEREDEGQLCGLFVKNLENVQGDERDVIVLSVCYGPNSQGRMRMNFGPINKGGGHKRLNVVFSRAKRHMAVVSSIRYSAITNEYNDGARCLRRYLQYAEAMSAGDHGTADVVVGALSHSRRDASSQADTPVVDALAARLQARGLGVTRGVGTSGFRVDLAVAAAPGSDHQVAVLVDTAAHYAANAPFERFHARPGVLAAFGWRVVWVLTKDWLADPDSCVQRVTAALEPTPPEPAP